MRTEFRACNSGQTTLPLCDGKKTKTPTVINKLPCCAERRRARQNRIPNQLDVTGAGLPFANLTWIRRAGKCGKVSGEEETDEHALCPKSLMSDRSGLRAATRGAPLAHAQVVLVLRHRPQEAYRIHVRAPTRRTGAERPARNHPTRTGPRRGGCERRGSSARKKGQGDRWGIQLRTRFPRIKSCPSESSGRTLRNLSEGDWGAEIKVASQSSGKGE